MDPSTSSVPDTKTQQSSDQPINNAQPPVVSTPIIPPKTTMTISVGKETGPSSVIIAESPANEEEDEDELHVAPQEKKTQVVASRGGGDVVEEEIELQPVSEISASPEVEKYVESTELEKPDIKEIEDAGVTHSGPGVIPEMIAISKNNFGIKTMPESFDQAVQDEKSSGLHDSKHWFSAMIIYIWRKLNPKLKKRKHTEKILVKSVNTNTVQNESLDEPKSTEEGIIV